MKLSLISPTSLIEEYGNRGDFHLTLAHLIGPVDELPNDYECAIRDSGLPIFLDNGLFENGESVPMEELVAKAIHLDAEFVFAPDVLFNREETEKNVDRMADLLKEAKKENPEIKTRLAAVVQANNVNDYVESYEWMTFKSEIKLIGLSILSVPESFKEATGTDDITTNRIACLEALNTLHVKKRSHLLGAGSSYKDVDFAAKNCSWVYSHDSSSAIWNAIQEHEILPNLDIDKGKTKVHVDFDFDEELTQRQKELLESNIAIVKNVCHK